MTNNPPKKAGWYWFFDRMCGSPEILKVEESGGELWAQGGELCFKVCEKNSCDFWNGPISAPETPKIKDEE